MMNAIYFDVQLMVLVKVLILLWCVLKAKQLLITGSIMEDREIEGGGEKAVMSVQIYAWDTQKSITRKIHRLGEAALDRKDFCWKRFQKTLQEGTNENVAKLHKDG